MEIPEGRGVNLGADFGKSRGEGGSYGKSLPWGWYGYFLEPHINLNNSAFRAVKRDAIKVLNKVCERDTICQ